MFSDVKAAEFLPFLKHMAENIIGYTTTVLAVEGLIKIR